MPRAATPLAVPCLLVALATVARAAHAAPALPPLDAGTALLVVAPHPDDETLCCAGVIQRVLHAGGSVHIVWITSGDASVLDLLLIEHSLWPSAAKLQELGRRRMREARAASALLGVPAAGQLFLGYPDRGVTALLSEHRTGPYTSPFTRAAQVPYATALFPAHAYSGVQLERDFAAVLQQTRPNLILAPSPRDAHPDHRAVGLLAGTAATRAGLTGALRYWIVHGGEGWPTPRALLPGIPLTPAPRSAGQALAVFELEPAEEDRMLLALGSYDTQMRTIAPFLLAFVRSSELFAAAP